MKHRIKITLLFLGLITLLPLHAQETGTVIRKRNRDIRIMEGVLDKVLAGQSSQNWRRASATQGLYAKGYGMIFYTAKPMTRHYTAEVTQAYEQQLKVMKERLNEIQEQRKSTEKAAQKIKETAEAGLQRRPGEFFEVLSTENLKSSAEAMEEVRRQLTGFYSNYTPALSQLNPRDRVAVLVQMDHLGQTGAMTLTSWITMDGLNDLRTQRINKDQFNQLIHFNGGTSSNANIQKDIDILLEILTRALGPNGYFVKSGSRGLYLEGFGALLFLKLPGGLIMTDRDDNILIVARDQLNRALTFSKDEVVDMTVDAADMEKEKVKQAGQRVALHEELFELVADYGHTLRLKPEERVLISIESGSNLLHWADRSSSGKPQVYQLKKEDIDAYHSGSISLQELKKRKIQ